MLTRRQVIAGAISFPLATSSIGGYAQSATPGASPVAGSAPGTADVLPAWQNAQDVLRRKGEAISGAFWNADVDVILEHATPQLAAVIQPELFSTESLDIFVSNQIQFAMHEVGAWFFGQFSPGMIMGFFSQSGTHLWQATPDEAQSDDGPAGTWSGVIGPGTLDLGIELEFSGPADALEVFLTIPTQAARNHPMSDVVFAAEVPIGDKVDTRVLPVGGEVTPINMYAEQYEWGSNNLMLLTTWSEDGQLAGITMVPQGAVPEVETPEPIVARLPVDGAWVVFWGGDTEFHNYHAVTPQQRYAADLMIWRDGSTALEPGRRNDHYHAFGQSYLAPVDGTVVATLDGLEDIRPQTLGSNPGTHPAGNHIVIESGGTYIYLAHCMNGSILVSEGDEVTAGDVVAAVGNSGNTSEPHVHIHAQTHPDLFDPAALGIPLVFEGAMENGEPVDQLSLQQGTIVENSL